MEFLCFVVGLHFVIRGFPVVFVVVAVQTLDSDPDNYFCDLVLATVPIFLLFAVVDFAIAVPVHVCNDYFCADHTPFSYNLLICPIL